MAGIGVRMHPSLLRSIADLIFRSKAHLNPSSHTSSGSLRFCVPDEEIESLSDQSREDSVQVLDSHVRAYSVPSSDDEFESDEDEHNEEISSSTPQLTVVEKPSTPVVIQHQVVKNLAGTTPEHSIDVWTERTPAEDLKFVSSNKTGTCSRFGKFEKIGASYFNSIELGTGSTNRKTILDSDTDDDGPEVLSTKEKQPEVEHVKVAPALGPRLNFNSTSYSSSNIPRQAEQNKTFQASMDSPYMNNAEGDNLGDKDHAHTRGIASSTNDSPRVKSFSNAADDFDEIEEDGFERNEYYFTRHKNYPEHSYTSGSTQPPHTSSKPCGSFDLEGNPVGNSVMANCSHRTTWPNRVSSNDIIDISKDSQGDALKATQRPPSPSDAALAKNASATSFHDHWASVKDGLPPLCNDFSYLREPSHKASHPWLGFSASSYHAREGSLFDAPEPPWPRYDDGPFANQTQHNTLPTYSFQPQPTSLSLESTAQSFSSVAPQPSTDATSYMSHPGSPRPPFGSDKAGFSNSEEPDNHHRGNEVHVSRLNISDIVNPLGDNSRSLKRKVDHMSSSRIENHCVEEVVKPPQQTTSLKAVSQEVHLNDAQYQDNAENGEAQLGQISFADSMESLRAETGSSLEFIAPAQKRQKMSSVSSIGIGKFVSGVVVGVVGAFAAFIATIPMSVQEEALQEIARAT